MKDVYEAFRKAMLDVLIPEIKQLQKGQEQLRAEVKELRTEMHLGFSELRKEMSEKFAVIIDKLDLAQRVSKVEAILEELRRKVA